MVESFFTHKWVQFYPTLKVEGSILDKYEYPWYKIRAFRNLISHEYFNIKMEAVWEIIINDLPELKSIIDIIINKEYHK